MNLDPVPPLLGGEVRGGAKGYPSCPEHQVAVLQEALQGGGGGGDAEDAARVCATEPLHSNVLDGSPVEGPVDCRDDILDHEGGDPGGPCENQLETALVDRWSWRCCLLGALGGPLVLHYRPSLVRGGGGGGGGKSLSGRGRVEGSSWLGSSVSVRRGVRGYGAHATKSPGSSYATSINTKYAKFAKPYVLGARQKSGPFS